MKILVTGGAGFLGLHLARNLTEKGHQIVLLDIAPYEKHEYPEGVVFIDGDVRSHGDMEKALDGCTACIHGAAALPLWSKDEIYSTNVFGTRVVIEECIKANISRFAYVSSTAVYGVPKIHPLLESFPMVGVGSYGESKILAEGICNEYRKRSSLIIGIIRPKTFIGPFRLGVFQILFDWINGGHRIPLIGNGQNRYQLLDVGDLVNAFELMITTPDEDAAAETYNAGAASFGTVSSDVGELCKHAGSGSKPLPTPALPTIAALSLFEKMHLSPLYKWVYGTAHTDSFVSTDKIQEMLGWAPKYSNAEALIRSYDWYMENKSTIPEGTTGVTHRVAWDQGILKVFKKFL